MRDPARPLGFLSLLALGINGTVGVSIFFVPAAVARAAPPSGPGAFALTALALAPTALCFARLGRRFPRDGGPVVFARAAFGERAAFLVGWVAYVGALFSTASIVVGLGRALGASLGAGSPAALRAGSALVALALAAVAASGLRPSARVWSALTLLKLAPLVALVAVAFAAGLAGAPGAPPAAAGPGGGWGRAMLATVFPLQGFEIVPVTAGRARGPREVLWAVLLTLGLSALLYVAVQASCEAALGARLPASTDPVVEAASAFGGPSLGAMVRAGANVSVVGVTFGYLAMTPRYLSALSAEGGLGGRWAEEDSRAVPQRAHWATVALVAALVVTFGASFDDLLTMTSTVVLAQYGATALAFGALALRGREGFGPRDALAAAPALALCAVLSLGANLREWATGALVVAAGAALQALVVRGRGAGPGAARRLDQSEP
ncbi:MAG TPA: APC family permease [Polyangiaceae bacterium]|nr:APC family permease [Polyangiaceae bacterium]